MPTIDERARHELFEAVHDKLGARQADTLMSLLPPVGWADVATKDDVRLVKDDIRGLKDDVGLLRKDIDARFADSRRETELRFEALEDQLEVRFESIDRQFGEMDERSRLRTETLEHRLLGSLYQSQRDQMRFLIAGFVASLLTMSSICIGAMVLVT